MSPDFERGWILGYTQGQYNMRRTLLRKLKRCATPEVAAWAVARLQKWLDEWPEKRRKKIRP